MKYFVMLIEPEPSYNNTVSEAAVTMPEAGPYSLVEQMLDDLHLKELWPVFHDNAIRVRHIHVLTLLWFEVCCLGL